jgi:hypothetical protein
VEFRVVFGTDGSCADRAERNVFAEHVLSDESCDNYSSEDGGIEVERPIPGLLCEQF